MSSTSIFCCSVDWGHRIRATCEHFKSRAIFFLVAFQLLDTDNDGHLSYSELFSLFRMVTGPTMTDDHVLAIITSILSRSDLQEPTRLTFEEFTKVRHGSVF